MESADASNDLTLVSVLAVSGATVFGPLAMLGNDTVQSLKTRVKEQTARVDGIPDPPRCVELLFGERTLGDTEAIRDLQPGGGNLELTAIISLAVITDEERAERTKMFNWSEWQDERVRADRALMLDAMCFYDALPVHIPHECLWADKEFATLVVRRRPNDCNCGDDDKGMLHQTDVMLVEILSQVHHTLKGDRQFMGEILKRHAKSWLSKSRKPDIYFLQQFVQEVAPSLRADAKFMTRLLRKDGDLLQYGADALKQDPDAVKTACRQKYSALRHAHADLRSNKAFMMDLIRQEALSLKFAGEALQADREVVAIAVQSSWHALQHAAESLRCDKAFITELVSRDGRLLAHAADDLKRDREVVRAAVLENACALDVANAELREDRNFIMGLVAENGWALGGAAESLRSDKEVVSAAMLQNPQALRFVKDEALRSDPDVLKLAAMIRQ